MIYPSADKLDAVGSKYALVIVAAKRASQIRAGARRLVDTKSTNVLTIAMEELAAGKIVPLYVGAPEPLPTSSAPTPVMGGLLVGGPDDDALTGDALHKADDVLPLAHDDEFALDAHLDDDAHAAAVDVLHADDAADDLGVVVHHEDLADDLDVEDDEIDEVEPVDPDTDDGE